MSFESFHRFAMLLPEPMLIVDAAGTIRAANSAAEALGASKEGPLTGSKLTEHVLEPSVQSFLDTLTQKASTAATFLTWKRGTDALPMRCEGTLIPAEQGDPLGVLLRLHFEAEPSDFDHTAHAAEARFLLLTDNAPVMIWVAGLDKACTYFNKPWLEFTGRTLEEEIGTGWASVVHPEDVERCIRDYEAAFDRREPFRLEYRLRRHDGEYRWLLDYGMPQYHEGGVFAGYMGSCVDITDHMRAEERLQSMNDVLEARIRDRTHVAENRALQLQRLASRISLVEQRERRRLARMLHDHLQQLIVAAKMQSSAVASQIDVPKIKESLDIIDTLLSQTIDASRAMAVELSPPVLHDAGLTAALHWLARWMGTNHGLTVTIAADEGADPADEGTAIFLFQTVRELLLNVVQHAQTNEARVLIERDPHNQVRISVTDAGRGFQAADQPLGAAEGLGLFSIQERIDALGGSMDVASAPGQGTRVSVAAPIDLKVNGNGKDHFVVPESQVPSTSLEAVHASGSPILRVMVVDDHAIVRQGLIGMLQMHSDLRVIAEAANGEEAVQRAAELQPDVVVMDINMPRMNGIEATRRIRHTLPNVEVIGLSLHREEDMAEKMRAAGARAYLTKDGPSDQLIAAIRETQTGR